ncbi:MAG TPA: hypothetical protein VK636_01085 [Gemmatimonadaceae bacterium]|nr:hypothetical protein [Gemmatimonadaceae bacterium]
MTRSTVLGLFTATVVAVACSDSGVLQPKPSPSLGSSPNGAAGDTAHTPPDTSHHTPPDTGHTRPDSTPPKGSSEPRIVGGVLNGIGPAGDTANYSLVAGATVVLSTLGDSTTGSNGTELARDVSKSNGSFSLGSAKPGVYWIMVTPAAGSPFVKKNWPIQITTLSPPTVAISVWLNRR